jgi:hypothetical protein
MGTLLRQREICRAWRPCLVGAFALTMSACGASSAPNSPTTATSGSLDAQATAWRIHFTQSGGFAGMQRELEVAGAGDLTARDLRRKREVQVQLADAERSRLLTLLREAPAESRARGNAQCNDCLEYQVDATIDSRRIFARVVDTQLETSGFGPLVKALAEVLTRTLAATQP